MSSGTFFVLGFYTLQLVYSYLKFYEGEKVLMLYRKYVVTVLKYMKMQDLSKLHFVYGIFDYIRQDIILVCEHFYYVNLQCVFL